MSTYAMYRLWIGIPYKDLPDHPFIDKVEESKLKGVEEDGLKFETIYMHGEEAGLGVEVFELDWITADEPAQEYDPSITQRALQMLDKVREVFAQHGIQIEPKIYHHLDLGG